MSFTPIGFSGTPRSISECNDYIDALQEYECNAMRPAFSILTQYIPGGRTWHEDYVWHLYDNWDGYLLLDVAHIYVYSSGHTPDEWSQIFYDHLDEVLPVILGRVQPFNGLSRVGVELVNEYNIVSSGSNDFYRVADRIADYLRSHGITNHLNCNMPSQHNSIIRPDATLDSQGCHFYFNSWSVNGAMNIMNGALADGITVWNTEVGADSGENPTTSTTAELNQFLAQCHAKGIGNYVWLNYGVSTNLNRYKNTGLVMPSGGGPGPQPRGTLRIRAYRDGTEIQAPYVVHHVT